MNEDRAPEEDERDRLADEIERGRWQLGYADDGRCECEKEQCEFCGVKDQQ